MVDFPVKERFMTKPGQAARKNFQFRDRYDLDSART